MQQYESNRKKRILELLTIADVTEDEYKTALKESRKKGVRIVLERDLNESMINNYNSEWLRFWNGNLDVQICLDFFSVITYITEYYCKDDTGTTTFLLEAAKKTLKTFLKRSREDF